MASRGTAVTHFVDHLTQSRACELRVSDGYEVWEFTGQK